MKKFPTVELLEDIATELGVDASFIEKDWFAVQVLEAISSLSNLNIVFTGGTSLSKGYGLIKRFSEDLDFIIVTSSNFTRSQRKAARANVLSILREIDDISILEESLKSRNESKFFSLNVEYPQHYGPSEILRPHLKVEFSFDETLLSTIPTSIQSFITQFTAQEPDCKMNTVSPVETAANKFSALLWRVNIKDRNFKLGTPQNDPTMIRHLHDLSALEELVLESGAFVEMVRAAFKKDRGRCGSERGKSVKELAGETLIKLTEDSLYQVEYIRFVDAMSYDVDDKKITFENGLQSFEKIVSLFYMAQ
ncbi:nucleotidyl transferase AbiEii/AbiGii toxin family protein [Desulfobacula sp.]|uniref:nucleotidyl transferase AbiEii/AbiGii toxin family protein n=1 Tax=Desulfobacula sp. TaxID=2593537 RepID=UPI0025BAB0EB|nr:nucleotidyl transferase AbiEii/AbiGii toxin family protein [Desulfobacula sp.]MBC2704956.1 nucleotidyl transferase AbiEii/AbiGii toxin family protein [Desulfobacula sp.]